MKNCHYDQPFLLAFPNCLPYLYDRINMGYDVKLIQPYFDHVVQL